MKLTIFLIAGVAILANAQCDDDLDDLNYFDYTQQNKAAQAVAVGSETNGILGSGNNHGANSGNTGTGIDTGSGTGLGTGTGITGNDASKVASQASQSSGANIDTGSTVPLKAASLKSKSSGSGSSTISKAAKSASHSTSSGNNGAGGGSSVASFTRYDGCKRASVACGWYSDSGYGAAISQAVYGGGPGSGATGACGVCWRLTPDAAGANEIVVKVNDLCPADEWNPLCALAAGEFFFAFSSSSSLLLFTRAGPSFS